MLFNFVLIGSWEVHFDYQHIEVVKSLIHIQGPSTIQGIIENTKAHTLLVA